MKNMLKAGDILLFEVTEHSAFHDKIISIGQKLLYQVPNNARFCHVAIVDQDTNYMYEAVWPKTRKSLISSSNKNNVIQVYRVKGITAQEVKEALTWAKTHEGEWYDIPLFITGWISFKHSEICSTYVSHSLGAAGLSIPKVPKGQKIILPDNYADDRQLVKCYEMSKM